MIDSEYSNAPRAIKFRVYYDYTHPTLKEWYNDKDIINVSIAKEFGISSEGNTRGLENLILIRAIKKVQHKERL